MFGRRSVEAAETSDQLSLLVESRTGLDPLRQPAKLSRQHQRQQWTLSTDLAAWQGDVSWRWWRTS